jgi:hypothetical protein
MSKKIDKFHLFRRNFENQPIVLVLGIVVGFLLLVAAVIVGYALYIREKRQKELDNELIIIPPYPSDVLPSYSRSQPSLPDYNEKIIAQGLGA